MPNPDPQYKTISAKDPCYAVLINKDRTYTVDFTEISVTLNTNEVPPPPDSKCTVFYEDDEKATATWLVRVEKTHNQVVGVLWNNNRTVCFATTLSGHNNIFHMFAYGHHTLEEMKRYLQSSYQNDTLSLGALQLWNNQGQCPLHIAAHQGRREVVRFLIDTCQADVDVRSRSNLTALMGAAHAGHASIIKTLLRRCARTDLQTEDFTVMDIVLQKHPALRRLLVCGRPDCTNVPRRRARTCKGCWSIRYCSEECHYQNWKRHKSTCLLQRLKRQLKL